MHLPQIRDHMLDDETISELKVLENPKLPQFVNKALKEAEFLDDLLENAVSQDWLLRWGISTVLVQVSKKRPELLKEAIPLLTSRLSDESNRMARNNIAQTLLHLSKRIPDDIIEQGAAEELLRHLKKGEDHELYDAIKVLEYIAPINPGLVKGHLDDLAKIATDFDNPVIKGEAERAIKNIKI